MKEITVETLIIGAGLTGLTTAFTLKKNGHECIILEKEPMPGGVIQTIAENGFRYEKGPNTGVIGNTDVVELFDELSDACQLEIAAETARKRYILKKGRWKALPGGLFRGIATPLFSFKDKIRILGEPFRKAGTNPHETLSSFVTRRLGKGFLDYAVDPFILGVYAGDPGYLIPKYALPKLYNLEQQYGSLVKGAFKKASLPKTDLEKRVNRKVFSFQGGLSSLVNALCEKTGSESIITGVSIDGITKSGSDYEVTYHREEGEPTRITAKHIISTIGAKGLDKLFPFVEASLMHEAMNLKYARVVEVALGFKDWKGMALDGFGGLIPFVEDRQLLGVLFMSSLFNDRCPEGGALLSVFMGGVRRDNLVDKSDEEIITIIKNEVTNLMKLPIFAPDLIKIMRYNAAIPQYGIESGKRFEAIDKIEKIYPGLYIGGNLRGGIGMADRIKQGRELAGRVRGLSKHV